MVQTSKAATKTGFHNPPPRERPLVLRGSCEGRNAPPLPSRPLEISLPLTPPLLAGEGNRRPSGGGGVRPMTDPSEQRRRNEYGEPGIARYSVQERRTTSASRVEPWISHLFTPDRAIGRGFFVFRSITEASLIRHFTPSSLRETSSVDAVIAFFTTTAENEKTKHGGQIARATDFEPCARNSNPTLIPDP